MQVRLLLSIESDIYPRNQDELLLYVNFVMFETKPAMRLRTRKCQQSRGPAQPLTSQKADQVSHPVYEQRTNKQLDIRVNIQL